MLTSDNVLPFVGRVAVAPVDLTSQRTQLDAHRQLSRAWRAALSDREYVVLSFILDHCVGWGRPSYKFTYRCFEHGTPVSAGVGKAPSKVREILRELEEKGAISTDPNKRDGLLITPNLEWEPVLPTSKRLADRNRAPENERAERPEPVSQTARNRAPYIEEHLDEQDSGSSRPADAAEVTPSGKTLSIPEPSSKKPEVRVRTRPIRPEPENPSPVAPASEKHLVTEQGDLFSNGKVLVSAASSIPERQRHSAAQAKFNARRSMTNPVALFATWSEAWAEAYHDVPGARCLPWGKREAGMVKNTLAIKWTGKAEELHDFLDWAVTNWSQIMADQFGWMTREPAPAVPSIKFIASFRDNFVRAFGKRSIDKTLAGLSGHERTIREGMLKEGLTHEQAMFKLAERRARQDLREEIEKGKAEVAHQRKTVQAERSALVKERRAMERQLVGQRQAAATAQLPVKPFIVRDFSVEEWNETLQLVAKMMEVDPEGE